MRPAVRYSLGWRRNILSEGVKPCGDERITHRNSHNVRW
jgi:hypothetical protein